MSSGPYPFTLYLPPDGETRSVTVANADEAVAVLTTLDRGGDLAAPEPAEGVGLCLHLSTRLAYELELSGLLRATLEQRIGLTDDAGQGVELAVHEALVNAIIHGNLGMSSVDRQTIEGLMQFGAELEARLGDPVLATRLVMIVVSWTDTELTVVITDQGSGYDCADALAPSSEDDIARKSGRGLALIQALAHAVTLRDSGRCIEMRFSR